VRRFTVKIVPCMRLFQTLLAAPAQVLISLKDAVHRAVVAHSQKRQLPSYRPLGRSVTPYHYLQPVPVRVVNRPGR
jgi:hypothetical protein